MTSTLDTRLIRDEVIDNLHGLEEKKVHELVSTSVREKYPLISTHDAESLIVSIIHDITGYGFIEDFLLDPSINEIMINSPTSGYVERAGKLTPITFSSTQEDLVRLGQRIASQVGHRFDVAHPIVDAWLSDGSRVNAIMAPIAPDGPCITIRRFSPSMFSLEDFCDSDGVADVMDSAISASKNIVFAGGTSSGKTSLLSACTNKIPSVQRVISIEETAEIQTEHPHLVRLVARSTNAEGAGGVSLGDLVKTSLRMRPDRLIVGEVRSAESFDLIQALNTGHDGSLCTIHANGPSEVLHRLASLAMFAHSGLDYQPLLTQAIFGIDVIVFVSRTPEGQRLIQSIHEVVRTAHDYELHDLLGES